MLTRRDLLAATTGLGMAAATGVGAAPKLTSPEQYAFPKDFLWGAATSGHQVEGNNVNSDSWTLEHVKPTLYAEPSGDACDHYHRYEEDIALVSALGLNTYRFSIEWSRIEPEPGAYSIAELDHYRRVLAYCHEHGVTPFVTLSHFTTPRWFAAQGGWENSASTGQFARYAERAAKHLGDLIGGASTFNEPNIVKMLNWIPFLASMAQASTPMLAAAARSVGSDRFSSVLYGDPNLKEPNMIAAHRLAYTALKAGPGNYPVGVSLSMLDDQAVGKDSARDRKRREVYAPWLAAAAGSDFVGVQTYSRARVGASADLPPEPGVELTGLGTEFWPEALEQTIRYAARETGKPVYVTENGIGTDDDTRRVEYIRRAVAGVARALRDGVPVRGYIHWSLLDNFEWNSGYRLHFGLVAVDRETFKRTPKPSAAYLGQMARRAAIGNS